MGKTCINSATNRGLTLSGADTTTIDYTSADMFTNTVNVTKGKTVTIHAHTGAVNIYELTFKTSPIVQTTTGGGNSVVAVYKDAEKVYYAVSVIKAADVDTTSEVVLKYNGTALTDGTTTEVYKGVQFGSTIYTAADFGGAEGDYVYAFKVDASASPDDDATALGKVKNIMATLSPVTVQ